MRDGCITASGEASIPTVQAETPVVDDARSVRAKAMFPDDWRRMEGLTGKPRSRLRARLKNQADYLHGMNLLPAEARCGNCKHMSLAPLSKLTPSCDLDSDFYGYQTVKLDGSCPRWVKATTAVEAGAVGTSAERE